MVVIGSVHPGEEGVAEPKEVGFEPGAAVGTSIWDLVLTTDLTRLGRYCCCFKLEMTEYSKTDRCQRVRGEVGQCRVAGSVYVSMDWQV